jgi:hypothetical protein
MPCSRGRLVAYQPLGCAQVAGLAGQCECRKDREGSAECRHQGRGDLRHPILFLDRYECPDADPRHGRDQ